LEAHPRLGPQAAVVGETVTSIVWQRRPWSQAAVVGEATARAQLQGRPLEACPRLWSKAAAVGVEMTRA
jgi:hypothetical protein